MISLPALLFVGVPVQLSLGTNKLAGTCASLTATSVFARAGRLDREVLRVALLPVLLAAAGGAYVALRVQPQALRILIVAAVLAATGWALARPVGDAGRPHRPGALVRGLGCGVLAAIGFYDGLLGPGTGLFLFAVLAAVEGLGFVEAAGSGRALNLASNLGALAVFALARRVDVPLGLVMALGIVVGARTGSGLAVRRGGTFVRPMLVLAALLVTARLGLQLLGR